MSDLIRRDELKDALNGWAIVIDKPQFYLVEDADYIIDTQPAVDAVEVVRCRDCKHWLKDVAGCTDFVGRCSLANYMVGATGYCVYGERKEWNELTVDEYIRLCEFGGKNDETD